MSTILLYVCSHVCFLNIILTDSSLKAVYRCVTLCAHVVVSLQVLSRKLFI